MVRPQGLIEATLVTLKGSPDIPNSATFVGYTPDIDSESIKLPIVEVSPGPQSQISETNTDFVGFQTDDSGNDVGKIFETLYTLQLTVAVWTAQGSKYSPRDLSNAVRDALYQHATAGPSQKLQNPDGSTVDEVWQFALQEGSQTDDLTTSPPLRRWQQNVTISASEQYTTASDSPPIDTVDFNDVITESNEKITIGSGDSQ